MHASDFFSDLPVYSDYRPTRFDAAGAFLRSERATWRVMPVAVNRDSGILARSNWRVAVARMKATDPTGEHHEAHRFGHWAVGWFEIMIVNPDAPDTVTMCAGEIAASLASYPVLSESDWFELERTEACDAWAGMSTRDRIAVCARFKVSIFAARRDDVPECDSGEITRYLAGE